VTSNHLYGELPTCSRDRFKVVRVTARGRIVICMLEVFCSTAGGGSVVGNDVRNVPP
jgi:hypothetical protein